MVEIFGTLGPSCAQADILEKMFREGMTGIRLNMSHSGLKESGAQIRNFHQAARRAGIKPQLLIDMQGPEIRIGNLQQPLLLKEADEIELAGQEGMQADADAVPMPARALAVLETGDHMLLDDGKIELLAAAVKPRAVAKVLRGGLLQQRKNLKIVGKSIPGPALTDWDRENIRLAASCGVTALMQPFVTRGAELLELRNELHKNCIDDMRIFAKIENREGIKNIKDILPYADMIVIARGDLGNDMPLWELPAAQKTLAEICKDAGKPFLVVTQMLASMVQNPIPTRAEVSDIFHAVIDGAEAVMVTNETAAGKYPVEVIKYLKKTAAEAVKLCKI